jgi:hypothetical protein
MTDTVNIFRAIQASGKYSDIITSWRLPSHAAATAGTKAPIHPNRIAEIDRLSLCPFEGFCRKPNTCGECCAGRSPAQSAMAMSSTIGVFGDAETYIAA